LKTHSYSSREAMVNLKRIS